MTDPTPPDQPRMPGVKYRKVKRTREETTVIDGIAATRPVEYDAWEAKPPRDWDDVLLRGVTGAAFVGTALTVAGSVAGIGGLLSLTVPAGVAYAVASGFDLTWLAATAVEHIERDRPKRAARAKAASWVFLAITMASIVSYGVVLHRWEVGAVAAAVPAMNKFLLDMLIGAYTTDLPEGTAHWMREQMARNMGRAAVARQLRRIDRHNAYMLAAFGSEVVTRAGSAMIAGATQSAQVVSGQAVPAVSAGQAQAPAPTAPQSPVPPVSGQPSVKVPAPTPAPASASGQAVPPVSGQPSGQAPAAVQAPGNGTSVPPASAGATQPAQPAASGSTPVSPIGGSIAATVRQLLADRPELGDRANFAELLAEVAAVHGDSPTLAETVRKNRDRVLNPKPAKRKTS